MRGEQNYVFLIELRLKIFGMFREYLEKKRNDYLHWIAKDELDRINFELGGQKFTLVAELLPRKMHILFTTHYWKLHEDIAKPMVTEQLKSLNFICKNGGAMVFFEEMENATSDGSFIGIAREDDTEVSKNYFFQVDKYLDELLSEKWDKIKERYPNL